MTNKKIEIALKEIDTNINFLINNQVDMIKISMALMEEKERLTEEIIFLTYCIKKLKQEIDLLK